MTGARRSRQFWERAAREVERGSSVAEVARRLGVEPRTLTWWRWRLRRDGKAVELAKKAEFIPVVMASSTARGGLVEIEAGAARVRVEAGTEVAYVVALVSALRSSC